MAAEKKPLKSKDIDVNTYKPRNAKNFVPKDSNGKPLTGMALATFNKRQAQTLKGLLSAMEKGAKTKKSEPDSTTKAKPAAKETKPTGAGVGYSTASARGAKGQPAGTPRRSRQRGDAHYVTGASPKPPTTKKATTAKKTTQNPVTKTAGKPIPTPAPPKPIALKRNKG